MRPRWRIATDDTPKEQASHKCESEPAEEQDAVKDCGSDSGPE